MIESLQTEIMNALEFDINKSILNFVFKDPKQPGKSIWYRIENEIIAKQVVSRINQYHGLEKKYRADDLIDINVVRERENQTGRVYKIPKNISNGMPLIAVYIDSTDPGHPLSGRGIGDFFSSSSSSQYTQESSAKVVNRETFRLLRTADGSQEVTLVFGYDKYLTNFPTECYQSLADLIVLLTKRYIVNELELSIDRYSISSGMRIEKLSEIIEEYKQQSTNEEINEMNHVLRTSLSINEPNDYMMNAIYEAL